MRVSRIPRPPRCCEVTRFLLSEVNVFRTDILGLVFNPVSGPPDPSLFNLSLEGYRSLLWQGTKNMHTRGPKESVQTQTESAD